MVTHAILWTVEMGLAAAAWLLAPTVTPAGPNRRPWND